MVGLIPKLLIDLLDGQGGADVVAEAKRLADIPPDRTYALHEVYDDAEWQRLLVAACDVLGVTRSQAEEVFADFFCTDARNRWPAWFDMSPDARSFLLRQPKIHNGFATGVADDASRSAILDKFQLEERDGVLVVHYRSPNQLCGLYQALARWIINHYGENAMVEEARCQKKGDDECEIHVRWP